MFKKLRLEHRLNQLLDKLRLRLSHPNALLQLAVLGLIAGLIAGTVIVAFRLVVEGVQRTSLPGGLIEGFEALPVWLRIVLPLAGAASIALCFQLFARGRNVVGVVHVMERLAYHQGHLDARGMVMQFLGAGIAIVTGHSVGREGPSVHLGAAGSSLLGQLLGLPNNSVRTLVACGAAAAIGASFNTPLAGVVFALEVVLMEYTLANFTPVILAAVSATALSRIFFGPEPAFSVPPLGFASLWELPYIVLSGVVAGLVAASLVTLVRTLAVFGQRHPFWLRLLAAGLLTGLCAVIAPEIMGIGYDTVTSALLGRIGVWSLVLIIFLKVVATAGAIGLGVPAGVIGPTLFIGAALGALLGVLGQPVFPEFSSPVGLYALLGMGAMMGATLQAPLSALTAVFELTNNPNVIMPGMLAIVSAGLTAGHLLGHRSVFRSLMEARGLDYRQDPVLQAMRRVGVASVMDRKIQTSPREIDRAAAEAVLAEHPNWIIVLEHGEPVALLPAIDLVRYLSESNEDQLDLLQIPAKRLEMTHIHLEATVDEALQRLWEQQVEAAGVVRMTVPGINRIYGILTREALEGSYRL